MKSIAQSWKCILLSSKSLFERRGTLLNTKNKVKGEITECYYTKICLFIYNILLIAGYTKVMVATGEPNGTLVQIIDFVSEETICQQFPAFPISVFGAAGGLGSFEEPIICGGIAPPGQGTGSECYSFQNGLWKYLSSMTEPRFYFSITKSPFNNTALIATGGSFADILSTNGEWSRLDQPIWASGHCSVQINATSVMIAGQEGSSIYIINSETNKWTEGPRMIAGRDFHGCGKIPSNKQSSKFDIVAVGGYGDTDSSSVEFLDLETNVWRQGPEPPFPMIRGALVQHPFGGVAIIGGRSWGGNLDAIYHLPHAGPDANWQKLPQKLKNPSSFHAAFLISSKTASYCTRN